MWDTENDSSSTISRDSAKSQILTMAREQGIEGAFKVFYDDQLMSTPDALPEQVEMSKVRVSEVLDQATVVHEACWIIYANEIHALSTR